jgi:hypothetical protein
MSVALNARREQPKAARDLCTTCKTVYIGPGAS